MAEEEHEQEHRTAWFDSWIGSHCPPMNCLYCIFLLKVGEISTIVMLIHFKIFSMYIRLLSLYFIYCIFSLLPSLCTGNLS